MLRLILASVLLSGLLPSSVLAQNISVNWSHSGKYTEGFKLYTSPDITTPTWTLAKTVPDAAARTTSYNFVSSTPLCFALTAYNVLDESPKTTTVQGGGPACLGKSQAPGMLSFSAP